MDLRILIVDDEPPARKKLRAYLKEETGIGAVAEAGNGVEAVRMILEDKPDIVFLDIQMPGMSGFQVIEAVGAAAMPTVVFVTAYDQYAVDAFEVEAVDYLLKPYDKDRFMKSFHRAVTQARAGGHGSTASDQVERLLAALQQKKEYLQRIMVRKGPRFFFVKTDEIMYISSEEKYIRLHTADESYLLRETMTKMEQRLDPEVFVRIHRSHMVNMEYIKEIQPWTHGDYVVVLKNGTKLNLSRRYKDKCLK